MEAATLGFRDGAIENRRLVVIGKSKEMEFQ